MFKKLLRASHADEPGVRIHLFVLDEFNGRETFGIENAGELLHRGRFAVDPVGLGVLPDEEVNEASRVFRLLPHLVPQGASFVRSNICDELMDGGEASFEGFRTDFVAGELVDLARLALDVSQSISFESG